MDLIPGLPHELGLECLSRLHHSAYPVASSVCRQWGQLLQSREFYGYRKQFGYAHEIACLVQSFPVPVQKQSQPGSMSYRITLFDPLSRTWQPLEVPQYPNGLPLFCQLASCDGKLVVMGGWDPVTYQPAKAVLIYDFGRCEWRQGKDMPSKRSFFASGAVGGVVYVAGGHDESKTALKSAWSYDVSRDEWGELTDMSQERDECEGVVIGDEFWVVSGYETEGQGMFEASAELYQPGTGRWTRVEGAWRAGQCPRSCVGVGKDGKLVCWARSDPPVRFATCAVSLGVRTLLTGSFEQGAAQEYFLVENKDGPSDPRMERIDVPREFLGVVQSGCCAIV